MQVLKARRVTLAAIAIVASALLVNRPAVAFETLSDPLPSGGQGPEMVVIPAGKFRLGDASGRGNDNERPQRTIVFAQPFAMGRYEVTFADWQKYADANGLPMPDNEGWGLYTELLPKEIGLYQDPYSDFGRLAMELWRACRLVVDTGIHAKQWSREDAIQYLLDNTPNPPSAVEKAIERYIVMPGQATAYKIGMLKIIELREKAKTELGDKFDIRGFHDTVLSGGALPLKVLEQRVQNWVDSVKAKG